MKIRLVVIEETVMEWKILVKLFPGLRLGMQYWNNYPIF